jgi:hypothetical protein
MRRFSIDIEWYVLVMLLAVFLVFSAASAADRERTDHNVGVHLYLEESMPVLNSAYALHAPAILNLESM